MSIQHVAYVLELGPEVNGAKRLVLISLANHADANGQCWPSRATIAREAGIRRMGTITEALSWLVREGLIIRHVNAWAGTRQQIPLDRRPNVYQLAWVTPAAAGEGAFQ